MDVRQKVTLSYILEKKARGEKMSRTVLYDYPMAVLAESSGIEIINMGDSIATVMLGHQTTNEANLDIMIEHAKAVRRGTPSAFIMGDMPFLTYQISEEEAIRNAGRYIQEAGMDCVKMEGGLEIAHTIQAVTEAGIPVVAHVGLTPQKALQIGGYKTQGRDAKTAVELIREVAEFEKAGAIAVVVEAVPAEVAKVIYERSEIPIFGSGCGPYSDSPMINLYDMLGFFDRVPKFAKKYVDLKQIIIQAISQFVQDCHDGTYPALEHCYRMKEGEETRLLELLHGLDVSSEG